MKVERSDQENHNLFITYLGFAGGSVVKNPTSNAGDKSSTLDQGYPLKRKWQPIPAFLPVKSHTQRSPEGYSTRVAKDQTQLID